MSLSRDLSVCGTMPNPLSHTHQGQNSGWVLVFLPSPFLAPSAPVINPQAPNSATGSSVRVCWSLCSDDTVESYQLRCQPLQDGSLGKDQAGEALLGTRSRSRMARAPQRPWQGKSGGGAHLLPSALEDSSLIWELPRGCDAGR